ncbi:MAG: alpha/beta fold hydrolase [Kineosporiaceae bacterium]
MAGRTVVNNVDRMVHGWQGKLTSGQSPTTLALAYLDWLVHLANSPGKQVELADKATRKTLRLLAYAAQRTVDRSTEPCIEPLPGDHRFDHPSWQTWPYAVNYQAFLLLQQWWHNATTGVEGVTPHHEAATAFGARQILDVFAPSNIPWANPEVIQATARENGANLLRGSVNLVQDWVRSVNQKPPVGAEAYPVGKSVAVTPGKVVYRNRLIELIQYSPATETVYAEPILIVPAWIMKYYILDLSPDNSLIRYLVGQGHTVFVMSWHNPTAADRDLGMEDYRLLGVDAAVNAVRMIVPERKIHAVGYCLGGTLLTIEAAVLARQKDADPLATITLLAAQTDFTEPGELNLFIDEDEVSFLEDFMWDQGYLDGHQMAGAFQMLRSNDLVWSRMVRQYLLGERESMTDLMAWNADTTRLPFRMHSEYLRGLFLHNDLAQGRLLAGGLPVALSDIRARIFAVGTARDHVAPWHSVYKLHMLADTELTFLLASGGHNAGIVSPPGPPGRRSYQLATHTEGDRYVDADVWQRSTPVCPGSWWPAWQEWLARGSGDRVPPPPMGAPDAGLPVLGDAPGTYVLEP